MSMSVRVGAVAGWVSLVAVVVGLVVLPTAIAGDPPITRDVGVLRAFFSHSELEVLYGLVGTVAAVALIPFAVGLRAAIRDAGSDLAGALTDAGLGLAIVAAAVYVISGALGAGLVEIARSGGDVAGFGRVYTVLYNGAADVLEGAWVGAFGLAVLRSRLPAVIGYIAVAAAVGRWVKSLMAFVDLPAILVPLTGILFIAFFIGAILALSRIALRQPAGAALGVPVDAAG